MISRKIWQTGLLLGCLLLSLAGTAQEHTSNPVHSPPLNPTGTDTTADKAGDKKTDNALLDTVGNEHAVPDTNTETAVVNVTTTDLSQQLDADSAQTTQPVLPHDLSPWGMFMQADWVVKSVMIGLVIASFATWTVLVAKTRQLRVLVKTQRHTFSIVANADSLKSAHNQLGTGSGNTELVLAAAKELKLSEKVLADAEGIKERIASSLQRLEATSGRNVSRGTSILATIGATAPFVGLFGTVWGIMNSFIGISKAQTTNLAVVAPGIAEALLATALGLVAAIPAVVFYNHFARKIAAYKALVADTSSAILQLVSRDLSHHAITSPPAVKEA